MSVLLWEEVCAFLVSTPAGMDDPQKEKKIGVCVFTSLREVYSSQLGSVGITTLHRQVVRNRTWKEKFRLPRHL